MTDNTPWPEPVIERLRALWAEGHSGAVIGRRLRVSRNAVLGKVHRLGLPPRTNPIGRGNCGLGELKPRPDPIGHGKCGRGELKPKRIGATGSTAMPVGAGLLHLTPPEPGRPRLMRAVEVREVEPPRPAEPALLLRRVGRCQYMFGERFHYHPCGKPVELWEKSENEWVESSYCAEHRKLCCVSVGAVNMQGVAA
jgi:hypothetical protein